MTALEMLHECKRAGVPMVWRTRYVDGVPQPPEFMGVTCTKRDRFFRLNGKIVPHGFAKAVVRPGLAVLRAGEDIR